MYGNVLMTSLFFHKTTSHHSRVSQFKRCGSLVGISWFVWRSSVYTHTVVNTNGITVSSEQGQERFFFFCLSDRDVWNVWLPETRPASCGLSLKTEPPIGASGRKLHLGFLYRKSLGGTDPETTQNTSTSICLKTRARKKTRWNRCLFIP